MGGVDIGLYVTRGLLLVFAVVVLGTSASLIHDANLAEDFYCDEVDYDYDCKPVQRFATAVKYATFTGVWGLVDAIVGLAAAFLTAIPWFIPLGLDALAAIFFLAGGINSAVARGGEGSCSNDVQDICTRYDSSTAFMFLGFIAATAAGVLVFLRQRSN